MRRGSESCGAEGVVAACDCQLCSVGDPVLAKVPNRDSLCGTSFSLIDVKDCEVKRKHIRQVTGGHINKLEAKISCDTRSHVDLSEMSFGHPVSLRRLCVIGARCCDPEIDLVAIDRGGHIPEDQAFVAEVRTQSTQIAVNVAVTEIELLRKKRHC